MKHKIFFLSLLCMLCGFYACDPAIDNPMPDRPNPMGRGIYILNYGLTNGDGAGLDYFSIDSNRMHRNVFDLRNGTDPGKGIAGMSFWKQYAFFTAEKSSVVWVINASTAMIAGRYNRLNDPRQLLIIDAEKTYLTSASQKIVNVLHTATLQNLGSISMPTTVEHLVKVSERVFTNKANSSASGKVYVIDYVLDRLTDSIAVPGVPVQLAASPDGTLWVLCAGNEVQQHALVAINAQTLQLKQQIPLPTFDTLSAGMAFLPQGNMALLAGDVYLLEAQNGYTTPQLLISASGRRFTSICYDAQKSDLYLTGYLPAVSGGFLYHYSTNGVLIDSMQTGLMPVKAALNQQPSNP